jgi:hypothetical protein
MEKTREKPEAGEVSPGEAADGGGGDGWPPGPVGGLGGVTDEAMDQLMAAFASMKPGDLDGGVRGPATVLEEGYRRLLLRHLVHAFPGLKRERLVKFVRKNCVTLGDLFNLIRCFGEPAAALVDLLKEQLVQEVGEAVAAAAEGSPNWYRSVCQGTQRVCSPPDGRRVPPPPQEALLRPGPRF